MFLYPKSAFVGRVIPKRRIYEASGCGVRVRRLFVEQVERIVWEYKLAPETMNLGSTERISEIQVFRIGLRVEEYSDDLLRAIDKAIPFPLFFELWHGGLGRFCAGYKRSVAGPGSGVVGEYLCGEWEREDSARCVFPGAVDLGVLYTRVLEGLLPEGLGSEGSLMERLERLGLIRSKLRDALRLRSRIAREVQFNKRIAINAELRRVTGEIERLGGGIFLER